MDKRQLCGGEYYSSVYTDFLIELLLFSPNLSHMVSHGLSPPRADKSL